MPSRRSFIAGLGIAIGGLPHGAAGAEHGQSDYLFEPGLTYLNTASLGPTPRRVLERTLQAWYELEANPVRNAYGDGAVVAAADRVRERAAAFLGCGADEILITRSTTEGMNTLALAIRLSRGDRVLTTDQEHGGGIVGWQYRARRDGVAIDRVTIGPTEHDVAAIVQRFAAAIRPSTRVISVSHVITSTGLRMPVAEIAALACERGLLCVVDGAQAVGGLPVDVKALGCHAYATSGHKWLMAPKGTGLLYVSRDAGPVIAPVQWELGHNYGANSAGIGAFPLVVGLGAAIEAMQAIGMAEVERHNLALRDRAWRGLMQIPRLRVVSPPPGPLATALVAAMLPDDVDSKALREKLRDMHRVVVKMVEQHWFNGIRLSPHLFNTEQDVDAALQALRTELA